MQAILNKSWRQHPTKRQLYSHLPPIMKIIKVRQTRHAGRCWRSREELISDVILWTPSHGQAKAGQPAWTYLQQLCEDTGCSPEDLPEVMNDREGGKRGSGISLLMARQDEMLMIHLYLHFLCSCFLRVFLFTHSYIKYESFLNRSIWPKDWNQKGITTSSQSGPGSNDNEGVLHTFQILRTRASPLERVKWNIQNICFLWWMVLPLSKGYSHHILMDRAVYQQV